MSRKDLCIYLGYYVRIECTLEDPCGRVKQGIVTNANHPQRYTRNHQDHQIISEEI